MPLANARDDIPVTQSQSRLVGWVLVLAFVLRMICMLIFETHLNAREAEMGVIARNIVAGKGFIASILGPEQPTAFIPPFEPYFFALIHYCFGYTPVATGILIALRSILSVAAAYVAYRIVRDFWSERLAMPTLYTIAFYPPLIYYAAVCEYIVRPPFSVLAGLLIIWCLLAFARRPSLRRGCVVGVGFGLSLYVQSNFMTLIPFAMVWMAYVLWRHQSTTPGWRRFVPLLAPPLLVVLLLTPWTIRNYRAFEEIVVLRTGFGLLLWLANNPMATGDLFSVSEWYEPSFNMAPAQTLSPTVLAQVRQANEVERDRLLLQEALTFIKAHPKRYAQLTWTRLRSFWFVPPKPYSVWWKQAIAMAYGVYSCALLGLATAACILRRDLFTGLFALVLIHFTLLYSLVQSSYSYYRMDSEPFCLILALYTLQVLYDRWRSRTTSPLAFSV